MTIVLALKMSAAAGETTFIDEAGHAVTTSGAAVHVADAAASDGVAGSFPSAGSFLSVPASADFEFPGQFGIGGWITPSTITGDHGIFSLSAEPDDLIFLGLYQFGARLVAATAYQNIQLTNALAVGQREHVFWSRDAENVIRFFFNGHQVWTITQAGTIGSATLSLLIGKEYGGLQFLGRLDDFFISKGDPIWTADFTPPTEIPLAPVPYSIAAPLFVLSAPGAAIGPLSADLTLYAGDIQQASAPLRVSVFDPQVFDSSLGKIYWAATVMIGSLDVSSQLTGEMRIEADEDSARLASLSVKPASNVELASYDSATVTIDITIFRGSSAAQVRRFTGKVEKTVFDPVNRVATVTCRDGWQERIRACGSADQVHALLGGLAAPCDKIIAWSDSKTDASGYFNSLLATLPGATFIDASGVWRVVQWDIAAPAASFGANDIFDGMTVEQPARADVPSAVFAKLTHRFPRLHSAEVALNWTAPEREDYVIKGIPTCTKAMVIETLNGAADWLVKGEVAITSPIPGSYPVVSHGETVYYNVSYESAAFTCQTAAAVLYRRWYQEVEVSYSITIAMGGLSDRDESIADAIATTFDASGWESPTSTAASLGIYSANAPAGSGDTEPVTGYEALMPPWPPTNSAVDHFADVTGDVLNAAVKHVVAKAVRLAAAGKRNRRVKFARPADPRWELGMPLAASAYGVSGVGQLVGFVDTYDFDSGACVTEMVLACPEGAGYEINYTASATPPANDVSHTFLAVPLRNHIGADLETPSWMDPNQLAGFLCNTLPTADSYDASAPAFETQFRVLMPEIPASVRDPLYLDAVIDALVTLPGGDLAISFGGSGGGIH